MDSGNFFDVLENNGSNQCITDCVNNENTVAATETWDQYIDQRTDLFHVNSATAQNNRKNMELIVERPETMVIVLIFDTHLVDFQISQHYLMYIYIFNHT